MSGMEAFTPIGRLRMTEIIFINRTISTIKLKNAKVAILRIRVISML